jgi:streptogramin lyase
VPTLGEPLDAVPSDDGKVFFTERLGSKLGRLDMRRNEITEWALPDGSYPHALTSADDAILFAEEGAFPGRGIPRTPQIARFDPRRNTLTEWPVATVYGGFNALAQHLAKVGRAVYFSQSLGNAIGRLDLRTNQLTEWFIPVLPGTFARPNGLDAGSDGRIWWVEATYNNIGMLDPATNTVSQWHVPGAVRLQHIAVSGDDRIVAGDGFVAGFDPAPTGIIAVLDPTTNRMTVHVAPTTSGIGDVKVRDLVLSLRVAYTGADSNKVGVLWTALEAGASTVVTPVVTVVPPTTSTVVPTTSTLTPVKATVTPVQTSVNGVRTGGFFEWTVPTAASFPGSIAFQRWGGLVFTERLGNKIGLLALSLDDD